MKKKQNNLLTFKPMKVQPISWQKSPNVIKTKPITWQRSPTNLKSFSWIDERHDTDFDGVPNFMDCNPWNPNEQGPIHEKIEEWKRKKKEKKKEKQLLKTQKQEGVEYKTKNIPRGKSPTFFTKKPMKSIPKMPKLEKEVKKRQRLAALQEPESLAQGKEIHRPIETEPRYEPRYEGQKMYYVFYQVRGLWRNAGRFLENTIQDVVDNIRVQLFKQNVEPEDFHITDRASDLKTLQQQAVKEEKAYKNFQTRLKHKAQWEHAKEEAKEHYQEDILGPEIIGKNVMKGLGMIEKQPRQPKRPEMMYYSLSGRRRPSQYYMSQVKTMNRPRAPQSIVPIVPQRSDNVVPRQRAQGLPPPSRGWFGSLAGTEPYRPVPYRPVGGPQVPLREEQHSEYITNEEETTDESGEEEMEL